MTTHPQPRHARAEIRAFAKELRDGGWSYERNDAKGHTLWSHPKASGLYKLAETPSHFSVQRARRDVSRLMGQKPATGKRKGKVRTSAPRRDFALEQALRNVKERPGTYAPPRKSKQARERDDRAFEFFDRLMREIPGGH